MNEDTIKICLNIKKLLDSHVELPNSVLYNFQGIIYRLIIEKDVENASQCLAILESTVDSLWRLHAGKSEEFSFVFALGQISALIGVLQNLRVSDTISDEVYHRLSPHLRIFETIKEKNGISHNELAELTSMSKSSLSNLIPKIGDGIYFISKKIGRNKYYYITGNGELLIDNIYDRQKTDNNKKKTLNAQRGSEVIANAALTPEFEEFLKKKERRG